MLLQQGRTHDAAAEARQILAQDPNHAIALGILSTCNVEYKEFAPALDLAKRAVASEPDNPWLMYILARAQFFNKQITQAQQTADAGLKMNPFMSSFWELLGEIDFYKQDWKSALFYAEKGLGLAPNDVDLINLRTRALVQLQRTGEAQETIEFALNKAPDDPHSHANRGWVMIEQDRYDDAIESFRESLRINPNLTHAREGLKEAIKGKNWLYRVVLKYFLWMSKLPSQTQWLVIIGFYLASRFVDQWSDSGGWTGYLASTFVTIYLVFVFSTWIGKPVGNLFLRLHPLGKLALDDDEKLASNWIGALLVGSAGLLLASLVVSPVWKGWCSDFGFICLLMLIPVAGIFAVGEGTKSRRYLTFYATAIFLLLLGGLFLIELFYVAAVAIFCISWVANYLIQKESREF